MTKAIEKAMEKVLCLIQQVGGLTVVQLAKRLELGEDMLDRCIYELQDYGSIYYKNGGWHAEK